MCSRSRSESRITLEVLGDHAQEGVDFSGA
jgi:hypothetical protein